MEEHLSPLAVTHLLQHTLRSLCIHENSQWVYAVFWRILPRNYPPPKWDCQGGAYDRSRGNRRNWILVWEDGFCNFSASSGGGGGGEMNNNNNNNNNNSSSSAYRNSEFQPYQGLQPELFFKMSHEIYNYGEGLIGKVAADHSHKWIHKEPNDQEINFLSSWHNSADSHPRTWEAQFQSGIKTIVLIAVREGVVQLGAVHKVIEDLSYIVLLRKKFSYIESIPGVLLPHPSSSAFPIKMDGYANATQEAAAAAWHYQGIAPQPEFYDHFNQVPFKVTPSMSSLEALLSKLPSVIPPPHPGDPSATATVYCDSPQAQSHYMSIQRPVEFMGSMENHKIAKEEIDEDNYKGEHDFGESSSSISAAAYRRHQFHEQHQHHHDLNISTSRINDGFFD